MFGIIRPCRHRMSEGMAASWLAHLCGLCLALRDGHGQFARIATNYDGLIISVLVEAQSAPTPELRRTAGPCPLRGMRTAPVAKGEGARLAAAVSLVLASAKVRDHVDDGDGAFGRRPVALAARKVARRWDRAGAQTGGDLGFDTAVLVDAVGRQGDVEATAGPGSCVLSVTEPTETATAAAFAHTAVLAGRPDNTAPLQEAGRLFGRLAHLLDAVEDLAEDARTGAWNPLTATGTDLAEARRLCDDARHGIRLALREVDFADTASARLAHTLLVHELERSVDRAFGTSTCSHGPAGQNSNPYQGNPYTGSPYAPGAPDQQPYPPGQPGGPGGPGGFPPPPEPPRRRGLLAGCLVYAGLCCTCQLCCTDHDDAWTGQRRESWCGSCGDCGDCGGCSDCCNCCQCCGNCDCGDCGCDGCDCGCDC
ncbi:hypothetical protein SAMN05216223_106425 [Actinacidiphila yanglinensis]|uniref:Regulatory protein n=1 Tax=Actinacidiphila yanglinensis TaxID=310779 RepID=A0A1H6BC32_9ACTN|nr:DUF5685 family protein [Actinacidiphila yanglinensis]SEG58403.1 hypothetical protein SAMN05216223_106425 [Actinacidiphila yanglinensis]